ncbi:MAG: anthranilate synthase component I family protein [Bacteroides sp.]|nr:anthranilate synthase component I family protein [Bacteroides sp.]
MERIYAQFPVITGEHFFLKMLQWGQRHFPNCCLLNSNQALHDPYSAFEQVLALGVAEEVYGDGSDDFSALQAFSDKHHDWLFGFLGYDLKNQLEELESNNPDGVGMPLMHFFRPVVLIFPFPDHVRIGCLPGFGAYSDPSRVFHSLDRFAWSPSPAFAPLEMKSRVARERYLHQVGNILQNIQLGYIYEMNYCVEFYAEKARVDPLALYGRLNDLSPTPFSCYYQLDDKFMMCASPERFMCKRGDKLVSQPIKGTIRRGDTPEEDARLRQELFEDPKERSENVMIVDLVRNDLSHTAGKGSVEVEELFGIYPFRQVHQMISTVVSRLREGVHFTDAIRYAFPMGSMTGAPKVQAMKLIEQYEDTRRGLYSGAVGYISPEKDFDFNVVIRSVLYNQRQQYLSYMAGSAITIGSKPVKEYEECLLKAKAMQAAVSGKPLNA